MTKYLLAATLILGFGPAAQSSENPGPDFLDPSRPIVCTFPLSTEDIRAMYALDDGNVLKIAEPIKRIKMFGWKDGGTIGLEITDAKDKKHVFCLDGRFPDDPGATRNLFLGALHPTKPGAKEVKMCGPEESALYGVMLRWADKHPQRKALFNPTIDLNEKDFEDGYYVREFLLKLDARFTKQ